MLVFECFQVAFFNRIFNQTDLQRQLQQSQEDADRLQQQLHEKDANHKTLQQELEEMRREKNKL